MNSAPFRLRIILAFLVLPLASLTAFGQQDSLASLTRKFDHYRQNTLQEKLYAHLDRSFYLTGETMWFKLYYVDGTFNRSLDLSKVAYVEILDRTSKALVQTKVGLTSGHGNGSLFLPASLPSGEYQVRAYTRWMRNFGPESFFQESITIINPFSKLGLTPAKEKIQYDVQFFPEGGSLVEGLTSKVAFRAVDPQGRGIDFRGAVIDEKNDTVLRFKPLTFGIGNFMLNPSAGHSYKAVIKDSKRNRYTYPLPVPAATGYVIQVTDTTGDRIRVVIQSKSVDQSYVYLLAHTRQIVAASRALNLLNGKAEVLLDKKMLGEGISHLTVFDPSLIPVCERLYFKQPKKLQLNVNSDQSLYSTRRKVNLTISAQLPEGALSTTDMSVAVFKLDSLGSHESTDIASALWLTSELRGAIESPEYYLNSTASATAVDNLMLTHGWSRFNWADVLKKVKKMEFIPEFRGHIISGHVIGLEPGSGHKVIAYLSSPGKNVRLYPSRSDEHDNVKFELREFYGSKKIVAQMNTQLDSIYKIEILSPYAAESSLFTLPEFDFSEALKNPLAQRSIQMQVQNTFHDDRNDRYTIPKVDSSGFYGKPDENYLLDAYTRFPTMEEVMREYVPGVMVRKKRGKFHFITLDRTNQKLFKENPLVLLDGVPVFDIDKIMALDPRKVTQLEIMTRKVYLGPVSFGGIVSYITYHGDLSDFEPDYRSLVMNYEGLQLQREFFSPQYETDQRRESRIPDNRNLVYWNPSLMTDAQGKQQCSFFTSDLEGKFKVVVQGITKDGLPGTSSFVFEVKNSGNY
jgi:hypothetical protein